MSARRPEPTFRDHLAAWPFIDAIAALALAAPWAVWGVQATGLVGLEAAAHRVALYGVLATFCAFVLTAATFVCTMTYQSTNVLMNAALTRYRPELRRNWISILTSTLLSAAVSLGLLAIDLATPFWSLVIAGYVLSLTLLKGVRALYWLNYSLFGDELHAAERPAKIDLENVPMLNSKGSSER